MFRLSALALALLNLSAPAYAAEGEYDYDHPELWKDMPGSSCAGMKNSPIAIESSGCTMYGEYEMVDGDCTFGDMEFMVTKGGVNMVYADDSTCDRPEFTIPNPEIDEEYIHHNVHIHLSSEHTIDGGFYPAEMHMVHLNAEGSRAAVLGTMIGVGAPANHPMFEKYLLAWEAARFEVECAACDPWAGEVDENYPLDPYDMLVSDDYYHYDGGLTTPACDEIVWWNFNAETMMISVDQYNRLTDMILYTSVEKNGQCDYITVASEAGSTSRPVQPLNGRTVDKICNRETKKGGKSAKGGKSVKSGKSAKSAKSEKGAKSHKRA